MGNPHYTLTIIFLGDLNRRYKKRYQKVGSRLFGITYKNTCKLPSPLGIAVEILFVRYEQKD